MNTLQKQRVVELRSQGESYLKIANALGISVNTIKSYCRRNNLGADYIAEQAVIDGNCGNCGVPLEHKQGSKRKRFCSDKCRLEWWKIHPEAVSRKAIYRFACVTCGLEFESYGNTKRKYCSRACYGAARRAST